MDMVSAEAAGSVGAGVAGASRPKLKSSVVVPSPYDPRCGCRLYALAHMHKACTYESYSSAQLRLALLAGRCACCMHVVRLWQPRPDAPCTSTPATTRLPTRPAGRCGS